MYIMPLHYSFQAACVLFLSLIFLPSFTNAAAAPPPGVAITLPITVQTSALHVNNSKDNVSASNVWNLMYVGNYALTDIKVSAMKFAVQYVNSRYDILPHTRIVLYPYVKFVLDYFTLFYLLEMIFYNER
jgi:hypothetical protein